ncbi:hypothetical protein B6S44_10725 [Bosea sp. Tri-44]|uniref:hypothetical protein n=1 Tax=Bosea sp. Tri-44 TaxID=1972137 RepID=UPI00100F1A82|nr:hypothetical protein [Bosea sp. Tri-44]RXT55567.1 hypothetical protein B6S44_10725 [Bosea sp. Tri-44]
MKTGTAQREGVKTLQDWMQDHPASCCETLSLGTFAAKLYDSLSAAFLTIFSRHVVLAQRILRLDSLRLSGPNGARDEFHLAGAQNLRKLAKLLPNGSKLRPV